jgi:hypothetical protein
VKLLNLIALLFSVQLLGYEVKMHVVDDTGAPVARVMTKIVFIDHRSERVDVGFSSPDGWFSARGQGTNSVMLKASKEGHYSARLEGLSQEKNHDIEVILPRILNPISLYAWHFNGSNAIAFPIQGEWVGFDFEVADWIAPYGKGKTADILLRFKNAFKGLTESRTSLDERIKFQKGFYERRKEEWTMEKFRITNGKWDGFMELSFPDAGAGVFEEKQFRPYSQMKLPHLAPEEGYMPTRSYVVAGNISPRREDIGLFLRTRVKRDGQGRIVSANYAKIIGDFRVSTPGSGGFSLHYYFNPVPNDRNLEFDPDKNLFPKDKPGSNVHDP